MNSLEGFKNPKQSLVQSMDILEDLDGDQLFQYLSKKGDYPGAFCDIQQLDVSSLNAHKISLVEEGLSPLKEKDQMVFQVLHSQFYGLQYTYEVLLGPFQLTILVLNLLRNSDSGVQDTSDQQLGSGSFGTVSRVNLKGTAFAVKRIPFQRKLQQLQAYDFEQQKGEHFQLQRCLREFCFYKVCSLLGIGPTIINSGYDLVCFNNCIEFKMELCQPISNSFASSSCGISLEDCQRQLFTRLFRLHSLRMVHRDIKPENILFSTTRQQFLLGDVGMSCLLKKDYNFKTLTRFMGTPNFAGPEMMKLLNGGAGYVNLYFSDMFSLKETLRHFGNSFTNHSSQMNSNSMSYNDQASYFYESTRSQPLGDGYSQPRGSDSSFNTPNSLVTLPTTLSLPPRHQAPLINHFQSQIIHLLCRSMQRNISVPNSLINKLIESKYEQHESEQIQQTLKLELQGIFQCSFKVQSVQNLVREWRGCSRHYGPESKVTVDILHRMANSLDKGVAEEIREIILKLQKLTNSRAQHQAELLLSKQLQNEVMFYGAFNSWLKILIRDREQDPKRKQKQQVKVAHYCMVGLLILQGRQWLRVVVQLAERYFKRQFVGLSKSNLLEYCFSLLKERLKDYSYESLLFCMYHFKHISPDEVFDKALFESQISRLLEMIDGMPNSNKLRLVYLLSRISCSRAAFFQTQHYCQKGIAIIDDLLRDASFKDNYHIENKLFVYRLHLTAALKQGGDVLQLCETRIKEMDHSGSARSQHQLKHRVFIYSLIANQQYIKNNFKKVRQYNQLALDLIKTLGGYLTHPKMSYSLLYNLMMCSYCEQLYDQALQEASQLADFLEKVKHEFRSGVKLIKVSQAEVLIWLTKGTQNVGRQRLAATVEKIIDLILVQIQSSKFWQKYGCFYLDIIQLNGVVCRPGDIQLVHHTILNKIRSSKALINSFNLQYANSNYELGKHYIKQGRKLLGMKLIWNYLRIRLTRTKPHRLMRIDLQIVLIYAQCLINEQSNRVAARFLSCFLKHLPPIQYELQIKFYELTHKAMRAIAHPKQLIFNQLTRSKCKRIKNNQFQQVVDRLSNNTFSTVMLKKYMKMLFFVELKQRRSSTQGAFLLPF